MLPRYLLLAVASFFVLACEDSSPRPAALPDPIIFESAEKACEASYLATLSENIVRRTHGSFMPPEYLDFTPRFAFETNPGAHFLDIIWGHRVSPPGGIYVVSDNIYRARIVPKIFIRENEFIPNRRASSFVEQCFFIVRALGPTGQPNQVIALRRLTSPEQNLNPLADEFTPIRIRPNTPLVPPAMNRIQTLQASDLFGPVHALPASR